MLPLIFYFLYLNKSGDIKIEPTSGELLTTKDFAIIHDSCQYQKGNLVIVRKV